MVYKQYATVPADTIVIIIMLLNHFYWTALKLFYSMVRILKYSLKLKRFGFKGFRKVIKNSSFKWISLPVVMAFHVSVTSFKFLACAKTIQKLFFHVALLYYSVNASFKKKTVIKITENFQIITVDYV